MEAGVSEAAPAGMVAWRFSDGFGGGFGYFSSFFIFSSLELVLDFRK